MIRAQRVVNAETGEVELYCHSSQRELKDKGIAERFAKRFEEKLKALADGLHKKGTIKRYDKILERIGRMKEKYPRAAQYYDISVTQDAPPATPRPSSGSGSPPLTTPCRASIA